MEFILSDVYNINIDHNIQVIKQPSNKKNYKAIQYFVKQRNTEWIVLKSGNKQPSRVYKNKIDALVYAKYQAIKREAVIYFYDTKLRVFDGIRELKDINDIINIQFKVTNKKYY